MQGKLEQKPRKIPEECNNINDIKNMIKINGKKVKLQTKTTIKRVSPEHYYSL